MRRRWDFGPESATSRCPRMRASEKPERLRAPRKDNLDDAIRARQKNDFLLEGADPRCMFDTPFFSPTIVEPALEREDLLWRAEHECVRLARALVASSDPNDRWREARRRIRGRQYGQLDELVEDLRRGPVPVELRTMGPVAIDNQKMRARIGDFLSEILWDAARFRAGAPLFPVDATAEAEPPIADITAAVHAGVVRGFALVGARGHGHVNSTYVLAGRIMELAGFTTRRVHPPEDVDQARSEAVRRGLRRAHASLPADALITIVTP